MGNVNRIITYDRAANIANAIQALELDGTLLKWHRLDDGVMGGRSETLLSSHSKLILPMTGQQLTGLHFKGYINTNGGGFTSIRAPFDPTILFPESESMILNNHDLALRLTFRGDGKTYKVLLSDGTSSFMSGTPSWQVDLPTRILSDTEPSQSSTLTLDQFQPAFAGGPARTRLSKEEMRLKYKLDPRQMKELGIMLSLKLSDGSPNPKETYGEGIFDFSLFVESIELIVSNKKTVQDGNNHQEGESNKNEL